MKEEAQREFSTYQKLVGNAGNKFLLHAIDRTVLHATLHTVHRKRDETLFLLVETYRDLSKKQRWEYSPLSRGNTPFSPSCRDA